MTEWSNSGNLKVEMEPGPNVTGARTFTRGSHQDDVLRPRPGTVIGWPMKLITLCTVALVVFLPHGEAAEEWRGMVVAPEERCAP